jgi:hypothetical protein
MITQEKQVSLFERVERGFRIVDKIQDVVATIFLGLVELLIVFVVLAAFGGGIYYVNYLGRTLLEREYLDKCVAVAGKTGRVLQVETVEPHLDPDYVPTFTGQLVIEFKGSGDVFNSRAVTVVPCGA